MSSLDNVLHFKYIRVVERDKVNGHEKEVVSYSWNLPDEASYLYAKLTEEGLILDVVENGEVVATMGMMAQEWVDHIQDAADRHVWGTETSDEQPEVDVLMRKIKLAHDDTLPPYIFPGNKDLPFPESNGTIEEILREVWRVAFAEATEVVFQHFKEKGEADGTSS